MSEKRIESTVLALPGFEKMVAPPLFLQFFEDVAPNLGFSDLIREAQGSFKNAQARVNCLLDCWDSFPEDAEHFLQMVQGLSKAESINLEQAIRIYGTGPCTDLVIAIEMNKLVRGRFDWDPNSHRPVKGVDQIICYARKAVERIGEDSPYAHLAYGAGLAFDHLALIAETHLKDRKKKFLEFNKRIFDNGLTSATVALELAKAIPEVKLVDFTFSAGLIHDIGKCTMALMDPDYARFYEQAHGMDWPRSIRHEAEVLHYSIPHNVYSSLVASYYESLKPCKTAVLFHHKPYLLNNKETHDDHTLALILAMASNISYHFRSAQDVDDPVMECWWRPETQKIPLSKEELVSRINRLS